MWVIETVIVAFSMFSALPMPQIEWNERNMRYAMCAFPLIGAVTGLAMWGWAAFAGGFHFPAVLKGAGFCLLPLVITGGIHLDGFADTFDALSSHAEPEKKREILKDPHIGAFGVMHIGMYLIASFAVWTSLPRFRALPALLMFALSRSLSGLAVTRFPLAKQTGLAYTFASAADRRRTGNALLVLALALTAGLCLSGFAGAAMAAAAWAVFAWYFRMSRREFGGLTGDLAGWFLTMAEFWMAAAWCLVSTVEGRFFNG